ncbi:H/ACA ribonucleoprotein complex non-core subunit NAF1 [Drosophila novamexicana]|uniref:H/ACA ribonucleoprotein complex non-core subunit NAF1 n=1 Tax=Drosophila novamexicana TaxID=47314 RepID=UPI0011E5FF8B|nr:H/ACA ribonucleoprotein complex non-core subunit NAF1 [Drosophila novamexicana]
MEDAHPKAAPANNLVTNVEAAAHLTTEEEATNAKTIVLPEEAAVEAETNKSDSTSIVDELTTNTKPTSQIDAHKENPVETLISSQVEAHAGPQTVESLSAVPVESAEPKVPINITKPVDAEISCEGIDGGAQVEPTTAASAVIDTEMSNGQIVANPIEELITASTAKAEVELGDEGIVAKPQVEPTTAATAVIDTEMSNGSIVLNPIEELTTASTAIPEEHSQAEHSSEGIGANPLLAMTAAANEVVAANPQVDLTVVANRQVELSTAVTAMECETLSEAPANTAAAKPLNGLSLLAAYGSDVDSDVEDVTKIEDSDNDDIVEMPVNSSAIRRQVVSVSSESDSSSSSDSDSNSEAEYLTVLRKKIEKRINTEDCEDEDDDEDVEGDARPRRRQPPKVRGEMLLDELPPIHQLEITVPEDECIELGKVHSIVDQLVLVSVLPNSMLFDLDTVLFLEKGRKVLGQVFDVLGQVADPLYCVRFNTNQQIKERNINIGDIVYCAPQTEHTQFVILSKLMQVRGSDASWEHDVEPPARFIDYSDDEAEREARWEQRKKRQRERTNSTDSVDTVTTTNTEASELPAAAPRQRGRRAQRQSQNYSNGNQPREQHSQARSQSRETEYNYHPSYNPGSWHSNYYHNYHPPAANFNMMPGMAFPMPAHGYGYMQAPPPPPHPYAMPPSMPMAMPPHMYPGYGQPPQPPN